MDFFQRKGGYGFGGYPPPFTDKIRKVVFEGFPNSDMNLSDRLLFSTLLSELENVKKHNTDDILTEPMALSFYTIPQS